MGFSVLAIVKNCNMGPNQKISGDELGTCFSHEGPWRSRQIFYFNTFSPNVIPFTELPVCCLIKEVKRSRFQKITTGGEKGMQETVESPAFPQLKEADSETDKACSWNRQSSRKFKRINQSVTVSL